MISWINSPLTDFYPDICDFGGETASWLITIPRGNYPDNNPATRIKIWTITYQGRLIT